LVTRAISTSTSVSACDVCGRNLLRGERAETYIDGGERHSVCELCTSRAVHGGWLREGEVPDYGGPGTRVDRRRSLFSRLRSRRESTRVPLDAEPQAQEFAEEPLQAAPPPPPPPAPRPIAAPRQREPRQEREPRHVRAVPTSSEHKVLSAMDTFNASEHPRTVAGISRSLGLPQVAVLPFGAQSSTVNIVVAWELCWYRYELDLSDEVPSVRVATQGYELDELPDEERRPNAAADEAGRLGLPAA
jgi:hypothetical protein